MKWAVRTALLVLLLSAAGMTNAYAQNRYSVRIGDLNYSLDDATSLAEVVGHKDGYQASGALVIPSTVTHEHGGIVQTYTVYKIRQQAFAGCTLLTSLSLPNTLTIIEPMAFSSCTGFTGELVLPTSLSTIGSSAFNNCSGFTGTLTIPPFVTVIEGSAFNGCSGFSSLVLPENLATIEQSAFDGCTGFTGTLSIPNTVTSIAWRAFRYCSGFTGTLNLPTALTTIGDHAFDGCSSISGLVIPASVSSIGASAFIGCSSLAAVYYNAVNCANCAHNYPPFDGCGGAIFIGEGVERLPNNVFYKADFTSGLVLPSTLTSIGNYAFGVCDGLTGSLAIPDAVTEIGKEAFYQCSGFDGTLTLGSALTTIGEYAFHKCSGFTGSLTIPESVTTIGSNAFYECTGFTGDLTIGNSVTEIEEAAFYHCSGFTGSLTIGNAVATMGNAAFTRCYNFTEVHYNAVNCADVSFFNQNGCLTDCGGTLSIGEGVERIPAYMFYSGNFTGDLIIPNSVTELGDYAFAHCNSLTGTVTLSNTLITIGNSALRSCSGLTGDLTVPNTVTSIGSYAFGGCNGFTGCLTLGSAVETIGDNALYNWRNISSIVVLRETPPSVQNLGTSYLYHKPVYIPCGSLEAYQNAPIWCYFDNYQEVCDSFEVYVEVVGGGTVSGAGIYNFGDICTLTATPNPGYVFDHWVHSTGELVYDNPYVFTVTSNVYAEAFFVEGNVNHEYVDLGLPSGLLWATCNVGADTPEGYGDYFAWGETQPKDVYNWDTYLYYDGSNLTKYTGSDGLTILLPEDDAATANWGNGWRMPTKEEWQELYQNTTVTWTQQNGVNGRLFTAPNGNSLFLPAAGCRWDSNLYLVGSNGYYWSSSLYTDNPSSAWDFYFNSYRYYMGYGSRYGGQSVRAVRASSGPIGGDANGDGEMNALDIVIIVNYIFGETSEEFIFDNADVNGDGEVNALDIVAIINLIFSK